MNHYRLNFTLFSIILGRLGGDGPQPGNHFILLDGSNFLLLDFTLFLLLGLS